MIKKMLWPRVALAALVTVLLPLAGSRAWAQQGSSGSGKIHGSVTDPTGAPVTSGNVSLYRGGMSSPTQSPDYVFQVNGSGQFQGDNIKAGSYTLIFRAPNTPKDKVVDQLNKIDVTPGSDIEANFDMSRPDYIKNLPPEQQKAIAEAKQKNAAILKENAQIKNLNGDLQKARQDDRQNNYADAAAIMQRDVALKPDAAVLWVELGMAQSGLKQWPDAQTSLEKGLAIDQAAKKPDPGMDGAAEDKLGEVLVNLGKIPDAQAAYDKAAQINPSGAGMYYGNEAIMMARVGQGDATVAAADKAIAANPNNPIPYYLKGQALIQKATVDPKTQKIIAPPGCVEAYQKYLDLAPNGQFANDAKQVLQEVGQTQQTTYRAGRKH